MHTQSPDGEAGAGAGGAARSRRPVTAVEARPRMQLKALLSWITALVVGVALIVSAALVILTSFINRTSESLAAAVESVRLAEEIEIEMLLHSRAGDPLVRQDIAGELRGKLQAAGEFVTSPGEAEVLREAVAQVDHYLAAASEGEALARRGVAYSAVQGLVDINVAQAQTAQQEARRWDAFANVLGGTAAALLVVAAGWVLWWLRMRAFRPLWGIAAAMESFGGGRHEARAEEDGPAELREVAQRFNQMAAALAAQRQAQMTFLGGVAHDLRNPLCALRMGLSMYQREGPAPDARTQETLELVARQTTYLERMIGDFLDIAQIEAGELELHAAACDLRELARRVTDLFKGSSRRHPVVLRAAEEPVVVRCDALRIEQTIVNLLSNAIKYSPQGGAVEVEVSTRQADAVVAVTDAGVGLHEDDRLRIFEPFTRVGLSRELVPGAGLGLYVVQKIVHAHGGRIEVESRLGAGSTFRLILPLAAAS